MGTPQLAATILGYIADEHDIVGVFTRPDAVRGRGKKLVASPVKEEALKRGLEVFTPESLRDETVQRTLSDLEPDVICVAAYGTILPVEVLEAPRFGCLNVHTSLLPRWRGAAPMERAIIAQDEKAGVCIMKMEEGLDTGPYCMRAEIAAEGLYLSEMEEELSQLGSELLLEALSKIGDGGLEWTDQGEEGVVYAEKIGKGELDLNPDDTVALNCARVRASNAAHPAHTVIAGRGVTVEKARLVDDAGLIESFSGLERGEAAFSFKRFMLRAADGLLELEQVKPDGKKSMDARAFAAGIQGIKKMHVIWGRS